MSVGRELRSHKYPYSPLKGELRSYQEGSNQMLVYYIFFPLSWQVNLNDASSTWLFLFTSLQLTCSFVRHTHAQICLHCKKKIFAAALTVPYMAIYARWLAVTSGRSLGDKGHSTLAIGAPHSPSHFSHVSLVA